MSEPRPAEWNASVYHRVSTPHLTWGRTVLDGLDLRGDEVAVDAGCGSGRLTAELLERLPAGRVIAVDRSANMLSEAQANLATFGDRVRFVQADVGAISLADIGEQVDLVFSTATFHWILDHPRLFRSIHAILKPGGRLSAQCGGGPNLASLLGHVRPLMEDPRWAPCFAGWPGPWEFADDRTTAERLGAAGFVDIETWLYESPTPFEDADAYRTFLEHVVLGEHLARLPATDRDPFLDAIVAAAERDEPPLTMDYWRLNLRASRPFES